MPPLRKSRMEFLLLVLLLSLALAGGQAHPPQQQPSSQVLASAARMEQLMEQCGYTYTKHAPNLWTIGFTGRALGKFKVIVINVEVEKSALVGVVLAQMQGREPSPELMRKLLKANHDRDYIKTFIDDHGDIGIRIERRMRVLDAEEFRANVNQLVRVADQIYAEIQPLLPE